MSPCRKVNPANQQIAAQYMYMERRSREQTTSSWTFTEFGTLPVTVVTVEVSSCQRRTMTTANATRSTVERSRNSDRSSSRTLLTQRWVVICGVNKTFSSQPQRRRESRTRSTGFGIGQHCQVRRVSHKASRKSIRLVWMWTSRKVLRVK